MPTTTKRRTTTSVVDAPMTPKLPAILTIERWGKVARYAVREEPHPTIRVFQVSEVGGAKRYRVYIGPCSSCDCEGGRRHRLCKHVEAVKDAIGRGEL